MKKNFTPPPVIYGLVALLVVSPVSASIGDNLSGSLLEAVESVKEDTSELLELEESVSQVQETVVGVQETADVTQTTISELKERIDSLEKSTTSIQYNVSAANGNKVTIPAQPTVNCSNYLTTLIQSKADWSSACANPIYTNPYYEVIYGDSSTGKVDNLIIKDKVSGYEFAVLSYNDTTDTLRLLLRQVVGTAYYYGYSGHVLGRGGDISGQYNSWVNNNVDDLGIFQYVTAYGDGLDMCNTTQQRLLPPESLSYIDSNGDKKTVDGYWSHLGYKQSGSNRWPDGDIYYVNSTGSFDTTWYYYNDGSGWSYRYTTSYGFCPYIDLKGDIGPYTMLKELAKMTSKQKLGTGIIVKTDSFETGYNKMSSSSAKYSYALSIDSSENQLSSICSDTLLTGVAGSTLSVPYTCTMSTKKVSNSSVLGDNFCKWVDVVIRDSSGTVLYWERCQKLKMGDNLVTFTIPEDLKSDTVYVLQVFSECCYSRVDSVGTGYSICSSSTISTPVNMQLVIGE